MRPTVPISALLLLLLLIEAPALGQELPYHDSLSTVKTSVPLVSWGRIGGVTTDRLGFVYVANFHDKVWRIDPEGHAEVLADGLYGSSGNAVDSQGRLLQANFFGHTISRIDRYGAVEMLVTEGLSGPVGIAVAPDDHFYVVNCNANSVSYVTNNGEARVFSEGDLFACPNSIVRLPDSTLLVANFNNDDLVRIDAEGNASLFATVPAAQGVHGNAHLAVARGQVYVTRIMDNYLYRVSMDGTVVRVAGLGTVVDSDGPASEAGLARPNGIATGVSGRVLYFNTIPEGWRAGEKTEIMLRRLKLLTLSDVLAASAEAGEAAAVEAAYRAYATARAPLARHDYQDAQNTAYAFLQQRKMGLALAVFRLNTELFPTVEAAWYHLGEGYRYAGSTENARRAYAEALRLNPEHRQAKTRLAELEG